MTARETVGGITLEQAKALTRRCFTELWGRTELAVADEILHAGFAGRAPGEPDMRGRDSLKALVSAYHAGFPGLSVAILGQLGERDLVVTEFAMAGVHAGRWMGVPATGRQMRLACVAFSRIGDGLIKQQWYEWERRKLLEQLGLVPVLDG
jgi:predicted ester cyclase